MWKVYITERIELHLGEKQCPNLALIAGLMALKRGMDDRNSRGLLRYHG